MMTTARPARSLRQMNIRIDDQIVGEGRVFVVRGFDPFGVPTGRVYLEDEVTGEAVVELMARLQQAGPAIRSASGEDSRGNGTATAKAG
jgi:hypothetical protein